MLRQREPDPIPSAPRAATGDAPLARVQRIARDRAGDWFDNPTSQREYRVQMRGWRSFLLFFAYAVVITTMALSIYSSLSERQTRTMDNEATQATLRVFFEMLMLALGVTITLVTPALATTAIAVERQRRALDLLFSSPLPPENFVLGKLISVVRFAAMFVFLTLPAAAIGILIGAAPLVQLLGTIVLLLANVVLLASANLYLSSRIHKPITAILSGFGLSGAWVIFFAWANQTGSISILNGSGPVAVSQPFSHLDVFSIPRTAAASMELGDPVGAVPLVLFSLPAIAFASLLFLKGAAYALSPSTTRDRTLAPVRKLALLGLAIVSAALGMFSTSLPPSVLVLMLMGISAPFAVCILPGLAAFRFDGERSELPDGAFDLRRVFTPRPSGALPYWLCVTAALVFPGVLISAVRGSPTEPVHPVALPVALAQIFAFAFATFAIARYAHARYENRTVSKIAAVAGLLAFVLWPVLTERWWPQSSNWVYGIGPHAEFPSGQMAAAIAAALLGGTLMILAEMRIAVRAYRLRRERES